MNSMMKSHTTPLCSTQDVSIPLSSIFMLYTLPVSIGKNIVYIKLSTILDFRHPLGTCPPRIRETTAIIFTSLGRVGYRATSQTLESDWALPYSFPVPHWYSCSICFLSHQLQKTQLCKDMTLSKGKQSNVAVMIYLVLVSCVVSDRWWVSLCFPCTIKIQLTLEQRVGLGHQPSAHSKICV